MLYAVSHITRHLYGSLVSQSLSEMRLTPRSLPYQQVRESNIRVRPKASDFQRRKDYFGNDVTTVLVYEPHNCLTIEATSIVEVLCQEPNETASLSWEEARDRLAAQSGPGCLEALQFVFDSPFVSRGSELAEFIRPTFTPGRPLLEALQEFMSRIHTQFSYRPEATSIDVPLLEVLRKREGVCQDFAHVMIGALRSLHLAARYVSGYLRSSSTFRGAAASHAWVSAFVPGTGWLSFDPTNDVIPSEGHITLAWGRDYGDVTPVKGISVGGGAQNVGVEVHVQPIEALTQT